ncbi:TauD/TfdA dioxygenase family protein [Zavarzinia sp. CC-PAN008]|uniref:TauD/TfdA dioxygenase family protein n=1 Tax=Zavarzinia sp. CC-PAN008 TaxID=3243332 RepID=UPI003F7423DC
MTPATIEIAPASPRIGAYVRGIDLTRPLSNAQVADLHQALLDHGVLFFRDQPLDIDSHKRLGRYFGELHIHPNTAGPEGHPEILPIHADANSRMVSGERWHSDVSCEAEPPLGSILYLHTVPPLGGDTLFASAAAAYDALSPRLQAYLDGLTATHSGERSYRRSNALKGIDDRGRVHPQAVHPVVVRHAETGRRTLFVNRGFTVRINDVPDDESTAILEHLYQHLAKPDFQVRFAWAPHSVAFWDNRAVQHQAVWDYYPHVRSGRRVTIRGSTPQ